MGKRQDFLKQLISENYSSYKHTKLTALNLEDVNLLKIVSEVYYRLGGQLPDVPVNYGSWDVSTTKFIIELDEERHFNRYRLETLSSSFYTDYPLFSVTAYRKYCIDNELECLKTAGWGKNWKNKSTEKMFLNSNTEKDISGNGSSRWRQRAYYDFLKDITSKVKNIPIIRISIYETYQDKTVGDLLNNQDTKILMRYLKSILP